MTIRHHLEEKVSKDCAIDYTLDLFHIMQKVAKVFPDEESKKGSGQIILSCKEKRKEIIRNV